MLNKQAAQNITEKLSAYTQHYATILITDNEQGTTRFANSEISQNVSISDATVSLTVYDGKKEATCTTNVLTDEGLRKLANDAEAILPFVPDGEFEAFPFSTDPVPDATNDERLVPAFDVASRAALIKKGVETLSDGYTAAGALTLDQSVYAIANNRGAFRYAAIDGIQFNTVVTHADGAAGGGECNSYSLDDLDIDAAFAKAQQTARLARDPVSVDIGAYTVVLSPLAFGDLLSYATYLLNVKCVDDGISFAIGKMGEKVFGENISIYDDVRHPGTLPLYFDYEGNVRKPVTLVENGVIKSLLYDNKTAARHKTHSTGHALSNKGYGGYPLNLVVNGGDRSLQDIIADTEKGIFINEFHYTNFVNPRALQLTGLTRNGAFLIENGKLGRAISTMRFTQNLIESLNAVTAISAERAKVNGFGALSMVPAVRIEGFHFTSKQ